VEVILVFIKKKDQDKNHKVELIDYSDEGYCIVVYKKSLDGSWVAWWVETYNSDEWDKASACFEREVLKYVSKQI
jgi:hypothetical protein